MEPLTEKLKNLPFDRRKEVEDFIDFLLEKRRGSSRREKPRLDWVGALKGLKEPLSSVELQHEVAKWRTEEQ